MICKRLEGRSVVVTGGASGVGRATAKRFAEEGASTVCLSTSTPRTSAGWQARSASGARR